MREALLVAIGFSPNIGGIETHFDDLVKALSKRGWGTCVLTYKPITTNARAESFERRSNKIEIHRIPWPGGLFYRLVKNPILEFLYLVPGLFFMLPILLLLRPRVKVIHSHGLIAGFVSVIWGKVFGKRVITTTHSIYNFSLSGFYRSFAKWIFESSDSVLTLSKQSKKEIESLGIKPEKVCVFTYWVDTERFKAESSKEKVKRKLGWSRNFTVLFVGRLVEEKGVNELLKTLSVVDKRIQMVIIGSGPMEEKVKRNTKEFANLVYLGKVDNTELPKYYSAADLLIVPSVHEEGFGRVIIEALFCGLPVVGANRGAIPEAINNSVGRLIKVSPENIKKFVEYFYKNPKELRILSRNARPFALKKYSEKNVETIINIYTS